MWLVKISFFLFLCFNLCKVNTQDFHLANGEFEPQIRTVLDYLNDKPAKVYDYNSGTLVSAQKKPDDITELLLDVGVGCTKTIYPGLPCSPQTLTCHAFIKYEAGRYQVLSDVNCSPKVEISIENADEEKDMPPPSMVRVQEEDQDENRNLDLSIEPVSKEQGIDFVAIRKNSVPCLGCPYDLQTDAIGVEDLLNTALRHIETEKDQRHTVINVRRLQQQVVAGMKYIILMEVGPTTCPKDADLSLPCPLVSSAETTLCQVTFVEKPWISKVKHIIQNNCTVSQEFSPKGDDIDNELSPFGGYKRASKKPEPNYNALANGNLDEDEMNPDRLADLEAQILVDPFIVPKVNEIPQNPAVFIDNVGQVTDVQQDLNEQTTAQQDHFQPIDTRPSIIDEEEPSIEILLLPSQTVEPEISKIDLNSFEPIETQKSIVDEQEPSITILLLPPQTAEPEISEIDFNHFQPTETETSIVDEPEPLIEMLLLPPRTEQPSISEINVKNSSKNVIKKEQENQKDDSLIVALDDEKITDGLVDINVDSTDDNKKIMKEVESRSQSDSKSEASKSKEEDNSDDSNSNDSREAKDDQNPNQKTEIMNKSDSDSNSDESGSKKPRNEVKREVHDDDDFFSDLEGYVQLHGDVESKEENAKRNVQDASDYDDDDDYEFRRKRGIYSHSSEQSDESIEKHTNLEDVISKKSKESKSVDSAEPHEKNNKQVRRETEDTHESPENSAESKSIHSAESHEQNNKKVKRDVSSSESSEEDKDDIKKFEKQKEDKKRNELSNSSSQEDKDIDKQTPKDIDTNILKNNSDRKDIRKRKRSVGQLEKISVEEKIIVRDLADFAAAHLDKMDEDNYKRVILQILGAKRLKLDGIYYQIILRLGISVCSEHDNNEKCREKLFTNLTKICKVQVHVDDDYSNPKVVKSQCQNIKKDENDRNRTNYSRYKRQLAGGLNPLPINNPIVKEFVNASLLHLDSKIDGENKHKAIEVISATKQVVSGMSYVVKVKVGESNCKKSELQPSDTCELVEGKEPFVCNINVWDRPWLNKKQFTVKCGEDKEYTFAAGSNRRKRSLLGESKNESLVHPKAQQFVKMGLEYLSSKSKYEGRYVLKSIYQVSKQGVAGILWKIDTVVNVCPVFVNGQDSECSEELCQFTVYDQPWLIDGLQINIECNSDQNIYSFQPGSELYEEGENTVHKHIAKAFSQFVAKHKKVYKNKDEYNFRMKVFRDNLGTIALLNKYEQGTGRYGITQFADLTANEFSKRHGLRLDLANENETPVMQAKIPNITLPVDFDWRAKGAVSAVKDQGMCGSCWAFSVTGNVEGQYAVKHGKLLSLSEQELVDCDKVDEGCNGGLMDNAYRVIEKLGGLESESDYPYEGDDEKCHFDKSKVEVQLSGALNISHNETDMAKWLVQNGPISIAINANAMQFYVGGVSHPWKMLCNPKDLDHGVLIVGYGVHTYKLFNRTLPFWTIKNSWGTSWGEQGYYRVFRGDGTCGLNQTPSSAIVV